MSHEALSSAFVSSNLERGLRLSETRGDCFTVCAAEGFEAGLVSVGGGRRRKHNAACP